MCIRDRDIVGCRHRAGERLKAQSKIVKGESNRAGLHAEIVESHPNLLQR